MTALEAHPEQCPELTLELARLSTEPQSTDRSRNLAALRQRLGLPAPGPSTATTAPNANAAPSSTLAATPRATLAHWRQLLAVGVMTGTIGFFIGLRYEHMPEQPRETTPHAPEDARPLVLAVPAPAAAKPLEAATRLEAAPLDATPAPIRSQVAHVRSSARRHAEAAARAPVVKEPDFARAVQLLARARRALERGEAALALGLLDDMDTSFPHALLDEERGATRVLALCANGESDAATRLAQSLFAGRPRSIYSRRLDRSCASAALGSSSEP